MYFVTLFRPISLTVFVMLWLFYNVLPLILKLGQHFYKVGFFVACKDFYDKSVIQTLEGKWRYFGTQLLWEKKNRHTNELVHMCKKNYIKHV